MTTPRFDRGGTRERSRGQSLAEFALILPVLLLLLLTAIDLGRLMYSQITITNAAKEGALVASQGGSFQNGQPCNSSNSVMCGVLTEAEGGFVEVDRTKVELSPAVCDKNAQYPISGSPPNVAVSVEAPFDVITPIIGDIIGANLVLKATAEAQCLVVPAVTYPSLPAPTATFTADRTSGPAPLTVNVDAGASSAAGGATITSYAWSFGASGVLASTNYTVVGTYTITLTVTDSRGQTDTDSKTITVGPGGGPVCPTVAFTATDSSNPGNPHRMRLNGTVTPSSGGWSWEWTGAITASGQSRQVNFPSSGPHSVTLTATKGACTVATTQTVTAP
jgi:PKD repeat protein